MSLHPCPLCGESKGIYIASYVGSVLPVCCAACHRAVAYTRDRHSADEAWNAAAAHAQGLRERIAELEAQRVPLTDEQIADAVREADLDWRGMWIDGRGSVHYHGWTLDETEANRFTQLVRAVERAHGIEDVKR